MNNIEILEKRITLNGWVEEHVGIFTHELYNMTIDTNSGGVEILDADHNQIDYISEDEAEKSWAKTYFFVRRFINSTTYRADCPF